MSQSWDGVFHSAVPVLPSMAGRSITRLPGLIDGRDDKEQTRQRR